jgi:hypothetical protein
MNAMKSVYILSARSGARTNQASPKAHSLRPGAACEAYYAVLCHYRIDLAGAHTGAVCTIVQRAAARLIPLCFGRAIYRGRIRQADADLRARNSSDPIALRAFVLDCGLLLRLEVARGRVPSGTEPARSSRRLFAVFGRQRAVALQAIAQPVERFDALTCNSGSQVCTSMHAVLAH